MTAAGQLILPVVDRLYAPRLWTDDVEIQPVVVRAIGAAPQPWTQAFGIDRFFFEDCGPQAARFIEGVFVEVGHSIRSFVDVLAAFALSSANTTLYYDGTYYTSPDHPTDPENPTGPGGSWASG